MKAGVDAVDDKPDGWVMEGVELSLLPLPGRMKADGTVSQRGVACCTHFVAVIHSLTQFVLCLVSCVVI